MSMNYPPGVTGFEDEIAGPRSEHEEMEPRDCESCSFSGEVPVETVTWRTGQTARWVCPGCHEGYSTDVEWDDQGPDPDGDRAREDWI